MSDRVNSLVEGDKISQFLQHTLGNLAEGYVVSLAKLGAIKDSLNQKGRLTLKQDLNERIREVSVLNQKLIQLETNLVLANNTNHELLQKNKELFNLQKRLSDKELALTAANQELAVVKNALVEAITKITSMEDAVSKLLKKVTIPDAMIKYMIINTQKTECIEQWAYREGGLIKPNTYDVLKTDSDWMGWSINGFLMSKLKKEGDLVVNKDRVAKYIDVDV